MPTLSKITSGSNSSLVTKMKASQVILDFASSVANKAQETNKLTGSTLYPIINERCISEQKEESLSPYYPPLFADLYERLSIIDKALDDIQSTLHIVEI
ncbi:hypothetical protein [Flavobacterium sp.]|uniref:hypothetical protein n=1 Tax=Flavobacterium sp. TaxID=239 RepID=UPI002628BF5E|nr:hypothetical protein [Flavobacterium sp.]